MSGAGAAGRATGRTLDLSPPSRAALAAYAVARTLVVGVSRLLWRLEVEGLEHVPEAGAYVVAPVHRSNIDTLVVAAVSRHRLRYMGKEGVWRYRLPGWVLTSLGGFPVRRGAADREALRRCLEVLGNGEPLVLFPEGQRCSGEEVQPLFEGAAYLASRAHVPLVPVGIAGSEAAMGKGTVLPRLRTVRIVIGEAIPPPEAVRASREQLRQLTGLLAERLQEAFDEAKPGAGESWLRRRRARRHLRQR